MFKFIMFTAVLAGQLKADLIALYRFDESSGDFAADEITGGQASWVRGSLVSPDWQSGGGRIGGAVRLPGTGNHVNYFSINSFPEINGTPEGMTIAAWYQPAGQSGYRGILTSRSAGSNIYGLSHENSHLDGRVNGSAIDSPDNTMTVTGEWYHVAWVWDNVANTQQLFVNGVATGAVASVAAQSISSNSDWRVGDDACCNGRILNGLLDDLAVYDEALTSSDLVGLYNKGLAGLSANEVVTPPETDPLNVGLVINEIHYDPDPKTEFVEFIEILNTNSDPIDLSGYSFSDGVEFTFPAGTVLGGTEYLLVAENAAALMAKYPGLPQVFQWDGSLSNEGEKIEFVDALGRVVDSVDYGYEFPWPIIDDGASMQLTKGTVDNDLGGAWRSAFPTPGIQNTSFVVNAPPLMRQVSHLPEQPSASESVTVSVKVTDDDGVASVKLLYQVNAPGEFVSAFLPLSSAVLRSSPNTPLPPNPAFEDRANWTEVTMTLSALQADRYEVVLPAQGHRSLVRYRIVAEDNLGQSIRAPFMDDPSLNFAYFSYNGVPDYVADEVYPSAMLTSLPVYHLITDDEALKQCWAYDSGDRAGSVASRKVFNWEGAMVYEGKVYDHMKYRLRQRNDRYAGVGRRSMRFRFQRGNYLQARDPEGVKYPVKWRSMNTSKMSRFREASNHGMRELVSSRLWNLAGSIAPEFQHVHFRVIDGEEEAPDQYFGDFYGLAMIFEDVDAQFVESREMAKGNIYKLKDGENNPLNLQKYQAREAVTDASDFINIRDNLGPPTQSDQWLRDHVDWESWYLYSAIGEACRSNDFSPAFQKNRIWYFKPQAGNPLGLMSIIPHDTDATWIRGKNDDLWNDPRYSGGTRPDGSTYRGRVVGIDLPKEAIQEITGLDGVDGENHPEREAFMLEYRNVIREVRDLLWQPETVIDLIDRAAGKIEDFSPADVARWDGGPAAAGNDNMWPLQDQVDLIKSLAFTEDLYMGSSLAGGRGAWLDSLAEDGGIPDTPVISYSGAAGFPVGALAFSVTDFSDPQGSGTFGGQQWRIGNVSSDYEWNATWDSGELTNAVASAEPPAIATRVGETYRARVRYRDDSGRWSHWSDAVEFTAGVPDLGLYVGSLVISEIMYDPVGGSDYEFVELLNIGAETVDLSGVRFTKGIGFDFSGTIAPGERILVVKDIAAFTERYGAGHPVVGEFSGKLDNAGERLKLSFGAGEPIWDFDYRVVEPWPMTGNLTMIGPEDAPSPGLAFSWRPAEASPGTGGGTSFAGGNLIDYMGGELVISNSGSDLLQLKSELNLRADDVEIILEVSDDLSSWLPTTGLEPVLVNYETEGLSEVLYEFPPTAVKRFYRYRFTLR